MSRRGNTTSRSTNTNQLHPMPSHRRLATRCEEAGRSGTCIGGRRTIGSCGERGFSRAGTVRLW
jgi:hypothetical protein